MACWDTEYHHRLWRPFDAVAQCALAEKGWESFLEAPQHPEYVSGRSTFAGALVPLSWPRFLERIEWLSRRRVIRFRE